MATVFLPSWPIIAVGDIDSDTPRRISSRRSSIPSESLSLLYDSHQPYASTARPASSGASECFILSDLHHDSSQEASSLSSRLISDIFSNDVAPAEASIIMMSTDRSSARLAPFCCIRVPPLPHTPYNPNFPLRSKKPITGVSCHIGRPPK